MTVTLDMDPAADTEPIRGVDLDRYARLSAEMLRTGLTRPEAIEEFVEENGITPEDWQAIQAGWIERLSRSEDLRLRYHDAATAYLPPNASPQTASPQTDSSQADSSQAGSPSAGSPSTESPSTESPSTEGGG